MKQSVCGVKIVSRTPNIVCTPFTFISLLYFLFRFAKVGKSMHGLVGIKTISIFFLYISRLPVVKRSEFSFLFQKTSIVTKQNNNHLHLDKGPTDPSFSGKTWTLTIERMHMRSECDTALMVIPNEKSGNEKFDAALSRYGFLFLTCSKSLSSLA